MFIPLRDLRKLSFGLNKSYCLSGSEKKNLMFKPLRDLRKLSFGLNKT
jgi:hypothetical protein